MTQADDVATGQEETAVRTGRGGVPWTSSAFNHKTRVAAIRLARIRG